jgi:hypothetical protein
MRYSDPRTASPPPIEMLAGPSEDEGADILRFAPCGKSRASLELSDIARVKVDAEPLSDDALEVDPPPPHDAVLLTIRPGLEDLRKLGPLLLRQGRLGTPPSNRR